MPLFTDPPASYPEGWAPAPVVAAMRPGCRHPSPQRGTVYEYCPECGAVRRMDRPGEPRDVWHTCNVCRL